MGANARVGSHTTLHPGVVLGDRCRVGASTTIHANVAIGGDGFGYVPHPETKLPVKVPHIGAVTIGDHVEIGAGATIDRGKLDDTIIADHVKLDNMVQIAHNVRIGLGTIICAQCGIAGSVTIGKGAVIGAQCGIADNRTLGDGVQLAAKTGVMKDLPPGQIYGGIPSEPGAYWLKAHAAIKKLAPHAGTLAAIAKKSGDA
ncbi:MAG: UDP-3-O-(3-hydroxymyristoyl)glucosamine N-acyltransferase [Planctomycetota bacterium]